MNQKAQLFHQIKHVLDISQSDDGDEGRAELVGAQHIGLRGAPEDADQPVLSVYPEDDRDGSPGSAVWEICGYPLSPEDVEKIEWRRSAEALARLLGAEWLYTKDGLTDWAK